MAVRRKQIRELVDQLLTRNRIKSAPVDVDSIATSLGIEIYRQRVDADVSGYLLRDSKLKKTVLGVNSAHPRYRQRFTVAHECGHYLLHPMEPMHVDKERGAFIVQFRDQESSTGEKDHEREANLFAAELLMPVRFLERDLDEGAGLVEEEVLKQLAGRYEVSVQAFTFRLANLGYIDI